MSKIHLASIGHQDPIHIRLADIATEFEFSFEKFQTVDDFAEIAQDRQVTLTVFSASGIENAKDISGHVQGIRQISFETYIVVLVDKRISPDSISFIKKSGANIILSETSAIETSQIEYICSQVIRGSLVPIKAADFSPNSEIDFTIKVIMPLNQKIMAAAVKGSTLSEARLKKFEDAKELYIGRDDLPKYLAYIDKHMDRSSKGIQARCRIQYLSLCKAHTELVLLMVDQSQSASFDHGRELLENAQSLGKELLINLAMVQDPWAIVNNSSFGESGSAERSTSIAALAGLLALQLGDLPENEVVQAGLLADIGLVNISPSVLKKVRQQGAGSLTPEEFEEFKSHPMKSINLCLAHKLPLSEKAKKIISCTHEKINGKGFPNGYYSDKIPKESQLIQLAQMIDERSMIKFGQGKKTIQEIKKDILREEIQKAECFSIEMLKRVSDSSIS